MTNNQIRLKASIRFLSTAEGGRSSPLLGDGSYRPNHNFFGSEDLNMCMGAIELRESQKVAPGDTIQTEITLQVFTDMKMTLSVGRQWRIQEGGKLVAEGTILEVFDPLT